VASKNLKNESEEEILCVREYMSERVQTSKNFAFPVSSRTWKNSGLSPLYIDSETSKNSEFPPGFKKITNSSPASNAGCRLRGASPHFQALTPIHTGSRIWENSGSSSLYKLWDFKKCQISLGF